MALEITSSILFFMEGKAVIRRLSRVVGYRRIAGRIPLVAMLGAMLVALGAACQSAARAGEPAASWPLFRGDAKATGVSADKLPAKLELLWKFPSGKNGGFESTAIIVDGTVFVGSLDGNFYALELATGNEIWRLPTQLGFSAPAAYRDGKVYVGDYDGKFYCLDAKDGTVIWTREAHSEIDSGPNFYGDNVLFGSQDATLYCYNAATGEPVWTHSIPDQIRCTPTIVDNRVFLAGCDGRLHSIDLDTGEEIGSVDIQAPTGTTPAVLGDRVFFGTHGGTFFAIDWKKGEVLWKIPSEFGQPFLSSAAVTPERVIFGCQDKIVRAVDPDDGDKLLWSFTARQKVNSSPVVVGDRVFFGASDGRLYGLNVKTGEKVWDYEAGGEFIASPAVGGGRLVIGTRRGELLCFGPKLAAKKP